MRDVVDSPVCADAERDGGFGVWTIYGRQIAGLEFVIVWSGLRAWRKLAGSISVQNHFL